MPSTTQVKDFCKELFFDVARQLSEEAYRQVAPRVEPGHLTAADLEAIKDLPNPAGNTLS